MPSWCRGGRERSPSSSASRSSPWSSFARLYLGVDHPFDDLTAVAIGVVIPLLAFRFFTPNEFFPVAYRRGKTAHLDVTGPRGAAIRQAVQDQLGLTVVDSKPVGLAGSGGSTPLRLQIAGDPDTYLFGKLYAMNHVRADRWYKLGRTILYGNLEDERSFKSVRQLIQHEDYAMRLLGDAGLPTARSVGIVELTPDREYLLVTEFFDGAEEIGDAEVDDQIIDEGLALLRQLWNAGIAHRDIKPANLLVKDGHLYLIDVAFAQVRPSPWREAVDLANMMLVLAVRTDPERVYQRALAYFTPDEIAEAFAAARGIASPTQLRTMLKKDGRDLVAQFRRLAPQRQPISLQRWGVRRIALALALLAGLFLFAQNVYGMFTPAELPLNDPERPGRDQAEPTCGTNDVMVLMAQSVPTAPSIPCISSFPAGWEVGQVVVERGTQPLRAAGVRSPGRGDAGAAARNANSETRSRCRARSSARDGTKRRRSCRLTCGPRGRTCSTGRASPSTSTSTTRPARPCSSSSTAPSRSSRATSWSTSSSDRTGLSLCGARGTTVRG